MCNIMIITKTVLAEQILQQQLQYLGHQVFCTSLEICYSKLPILVNFFESIIVSESISNEETQLIAKQVKNKTQEVELLRKIKTMPSKEQSAEIIELGLDGYLFAEASLEELREKYAQKKWKSDNASTAVSLVDPRFLTIRLSKNEEKFIKFLLKNLGKSIERMIISDELWGNESTNSNMSQLSTLIRKINNKFENAGLKGKVILTRWGRGYLLNPKHEDLVLSVLAKQNNK